MYYKSNASTTYPSGSDIVGKKHVTSSLVKHFMNRPQIEDKSKKTIYTDLWAGDVWTAHFNILTEDCFNLCSSNGVIVGNS